MSANAPRGLSAVEPIGVAFERMRRILFDPFDAGKWFVLGFCAFLAQLGEGGPGGGANLRLPGGFPGGGGGGGGGGPFALPPAIRQALPKALPVLIAMVASIVLVVFAIGLVFLWLSSRGKFMFLDGVVQNRAAVSEPWTRFGDAAWSLFVFRAVVALIAMILMGGILAGTLLVIWPVLNGGHVERIWMPLTALGLGAFVIVLPLMVIHFLVNQFFVPIMWLRGGGVGDAWAEFKQRVLPELGALILFAVIYVLLSIGAWLIAVVATCLTCCLAALPYLGTVILLPIPVFFRCWSLEFLAQLGGDYERLRGGVDVGGTFD